MNIDVISSSGIAWVNAMQPPRSEEKVFQSWLTVWTSVAVTADQKPASSGYSSISDQCTGHSPRSRLNSSWGGPFCQCSGSPTLISSRPWSVSAAISSSGSRGLLRRRLLAGWPVSL